MQQHTNYVNNLVAFDAIVHEDKFNNFKRNPNFTCILEHVSYKQGIEYINYIRVLCNNYNYNFNELHWNKYIKNDIYGNPNKFNYYEQLKEIELSTYDISPTTLRYICFGIQILNYIQCNKINNLKILEVGGGYGGQCKILFDICLQFNIKINSYTLIDLEHVSKLQQYYLTNLKVENIKTLSFDTCLQYVDSSYDLFISNYALGEFVTDIQNFYINNILNRCNKFFITWNTKPINSNLKYNNINEEIPQTGHKEFPNIILTK